MKNIIKAEKEEEEEEEEKENVFCSEDIQRKMSYANAIGSVDITRINDIMHKARPTVQICLDSKAENLLLNFLGDSGLTKEIDGKKVTYASSDIIFDHKIPLMDFEIELNDENMADSHILYRVAIFPDYESRIEKADLGKITAVGFMKWKKKVSLIYVTKGDDAISFPLIWKENYTEDEMDVGTSIWGFLGLLWFSIEFSLLQPMIRDVYPHPQRIAVKTSNRNRKNGKKKSKEYVLKYVNRIVINADTLKTAITKTIGKE